MSKTKELKLENNTSNNKALLDYGECIECSQELDGIAYFMGQDVCKKCIVKKHKKVMGR